MGLFNRKKNKAAEEPKKTIRAGDTCKKGHEAYDKEDYSTAVSLYRQAIEEGDPVGINALGVCYFFGKGVEKDLGQAYKLYERAASAGVPAAQANLGLLYKNGTYVEQDIEKALYWYKQAAEQGFSKGQFWLGEFYKNGTGVEKNYEKALYWYEKAAEQGHVNSQRETGNFYGGSFDKNLCNLSKAAYWYEKAAEQGDAFSQYAAGDGYFKGQGVKKDLEKARHWLSLSAGQGNEFGQFQLANTYEAEGNGEKYIFWLTKAAEQELGAAQCNLGVEYVTAKYVKKDLQKALYWMEKAEKNNVPQAKGAIQEILEMMQKEKTEKDLRTLDADRLLSLGDDYYQKKDYKNAFPYIEKAAQMGHSRAQAMLGAWYAGGLDKDGRESEADLEQAQYWMEKAASQNEPNAKEILRNIIRVRAADDYNTGIHKIKDRVVDRSFGTTIEDFSEAAPYLEKAGEIGLLEAQVLLASHYLYGECDCISKLHSNSASSLWAGENINTTMGIYWLKKAVAQEDPNSMFTYAKCLLFGSRNLGFASDVLFESGQVDADQYPNAKEAFDMAVRASDLGCSEAASWLSKAEKNHFAGAGEALRRTKSYQEWEEKDRKQKAWWEKEGARLEELFETGQKYYEKEEYEKALPYFKEAADGGYKKAQQRLAYCYMEGLGIEKDDEQSDYWFLKSMESD